MAKRYGHKERERERERKREEGKFQGSRVQGLEFQVQSLGCMVQISRLASRAGEESVRVRSEVRALGVGAWGRCQTNLAPARQKKASF